MKTKNSLRKGNLLFYHGTMNTGKTTHLLQSCYDYDSNGYNTVVLKPYVDTKGGDTIVSRLGVSRKVDYKVKEDDSIIQIIDNHLKDVNPIHAIFVDEVQFLNNHHIKELYMIAHKYNIIVSAYGLRTNFKGEPFEASSYLLSIADKTQEISTICSCGEKATMNSRLINGEIVKEGSEVLIDTEHQSVSYKPLCGKCFVEKVLT